MFYSYRCDCCKNEETRNVMSEHREGQYCACGFRLTQVIPKDVSIGIPKTLFNSKFSNTHEEYKSLEKQGLEPISDVKKSIAYVEKIQERKKEVHKKSVKKLYEKSAAIAKDKSIQKKIVAELKTGESATATLIGNDIGKD